MAKSINAPIDWKNKITGYGVKPASEFVAHPNNWRRHPEAQRQAVRASLDTLGWIDVVIESVRSGYLIDGHERIWGALQNDDADVPYIQVDLTEAEERQALLSLDPISAMAEADKEKLAELLRQTQSDDARVTAMLAELAEKEGLHYGDEPPEDPGAQIDRTEELLKIWQVNSGDLWEIPSKSVPDSAHYLICGDCTDRAVVERVMRGKKADLVFTDPPYNVNYQANESVESLKARNRRADGLVIENDAMSDSDFDKFLISFLEAMPLKDGGAYYLCAPAGRTETQFRNALDCVSGLSLRECIVWIKDQFVFGRQDYHWRHESILYGWKKGAAHYFTNDRTQDTVWEVDRSTVSKFHPTMKPIELPEKAISNSSRPGWIVYDPFAGSGTTGIACERLGRQARLVEISQAYTAVCLQRFADLGLAPRRME